MSLPDHLAALRDEAMRVSCAAWAIQRRWPLVGRVEMVGPCPSCGGTDRFSINATKNLFNCRQCGLRGEGVIALVMQSESVEFTVACERITGRRADAPVDAARADKLRREAEAAQRQREAEAARYREKARKAGYEIWVSGWAPDWAGDSAVAGYLAGRGISPDAAQQRLILLREYDALPWREEYRDERGRKAWRTVHTGPAMLAAVQLPDGRFGAVHQTWLDPAQPKGRLVLPPREEVTADGEIKAVARPTKKVLGTKKGGAIRLYTPAGASRIVMGEGIETTLTPLCHAPEPETAYWAGVDLGNMAGKAARAESGGQLHEVPDMQDTECFLPPDWCRELVYFAEDDGAESHSVEKAWRGLRRAEALRELARAADPALPPLAVFYVPPIESGDINDLVRAGR